MNKKIDAKFKQFQTKTLKFKNLWNRDKDISIFKANRLSFRDFNLNKLSQKIKALKLRLLNYFKKILSGIDFPSLRILSLILKSYYVENVKNHLAKLKTLYIIALVIVVLCIILNHLIFLY